MKNRVAIPKEHLEAFCLRWKVAEFALFGSVLRDDFRSDSDVDVLVSFMPETRYGLLDLARMQKELEVILGREVDLVEKEAVEQSRNYLRRKAILSSAEVVYAAR
jgi:predicted nucleotidyltransferase